MTRKPTKPTKTTFSLTLRVLGYKEEDGHWVAHCLETDLVGEGRSFEEAAESLKELTEMQVSFAVQNKNMDLVYRPAPTWVIEAFMSAQVEAFRSFPNPPVREDRRGGVLTLLPADLGKARFLAAHV